MSTAAKSTGRNVARNWDLAVTSSALLVIVGGIAFPHIRKLIASSDETQNDEG
jgi:hypothetical protein